MASPPQTKVSSLLNSIFATAKGRYHDRHVAWTNLSGVLAGRFSLPIAMISLQQQGDLDLLLCCMEEEFANKATTGAGDTDVDFTFHYQKMLSEGWVVGCYETLRAFQQRDVERGAQTDAGFYSTFILDAVCRSRAVADAYREIRDRQRQENEGASEPCCQPAKQRCK